MNMLSWMIYAADVLGSLNQALVVGGFILIAMAIVFVIFGPMYAEDMTANLDDEKRMKGAIPGRASKMVIWGTIFLFLSVIVPSTNTIYAIAASELGHRALQDPGVNEISREAYDTLKHWLRTQRGEK